MVIAIDLTALSFHLTGIERYAMCVTEKMLEFDKNNKYILIFRNETHKMFAKYLSNSNVESVILKGNNKLIFYQIILPFALYRIKAQRYLFFAFTSPILFRKRGIYNTIHDMGPWDVPKSFKNLQRLYFKTTIRCSAHASERIITVSEFSKNRIEKILGISSEKIVVAYSAISSDVTNCSKVQYNEVKQECGLPDKYIMSLSTLEPRKNLQLLLGAYVNIADKVDYDLVLVGRQGWKMEKVISKYNMLNRIHITGFVKDEYVAHIYKNAICFVFPTLYEGFGLPPVEALAHNVAVVSSDAASMPEVLQDRAIYFASNSMNELENILLHLNQKIAEVSRGLNHRQIYKYSFETSAKKILKVITARDK